MKKEINLEKLKKHVNRKAKGTSLNTYFERLVLAGYSHANCTTRSHLKCTTHSHESVPPFSSKWATRSHESGPLYLAASEQI